MTTKTLIYSTVGIFLFFTGAYIFISPIATKTLDAPIVSDGNNNVEQSTSTEQEVKVEQVVKDEKEVSVESKKPTESKPSTQNTTTETKSSASGYTIEDVALHNTVSSCWSIINGNVYDLTSYISKHPGGEKNILRICGRDGTSAFEGQHGGESRPENILANYKIGSLN